MSNLMTDITCRGCSLLCDDLTLSIEGGELLECENGCSQSKDWIRSSLRAVSTEKLSKTDQSIETAKNWLQEASSPLVCGFEGLTLEAEALLVDLAKKEQARLCAGTSPEKAATYQRYGGSTCTLGEVRQRADLVLVGNCDLLTVWPRFDQQILSKSGRFLPPGKPRQLIFLGDASQLEDSSRYSEIIDIPVHQLEQALLVLRRIIQKQSIPLSKSDNILGLQVIERLQTLAEKLLTAWYPVLFHDDSLVLNGALWTKLVNEVNQLSRMHSLNVIPGRAKGSPSETILAMTGFPDHMIFNGVSDENSAEILHDHHRYQAARLIKKQETDLVIYAGDLLSEKWLNLLKNIAPPARLIAIHSGATQLPPLEVPVLEILTQIPGIHEAGTALRCDGVPLPLRSMETSHRPTVAEVVGNFLDLSAS